MTNQEYLSVREIASILKITEQSVRTAIRTGNLKGTMVGKQWVVLPQHLDEFLNRSDFLIEPDDRQRPSSEIPDIVALSFFSGAMGLDLGMESGGIKPILACEIDKSCRKTIITNRPEIGLIGDICAYSAEQIRFMANIPQNTEIDVIFGGPPCQAFSTAGNRKGFDDERGNVFLRFVDLVSELRPKYVVIENVRGLLSAPYHLDPKDNGSEVVKGGALLYVLDKLKKSRYTASFNLYNAANYGAPQIRERVVIMGCKNGKKMPYLHPTNSDGGSHGLPPWRTLKDALNGLDENNHHFVKFPEERLKYYRMLKAGQYWKNLPLDAQKEALGKSFYLSGGKTGFLRRLSFDKPSPTLVTHPAMPATDLAHPVEDRPLSVEEYRRIQGFPDDWKICGNLLDQYRQIGNAVPISMGKAIACAIIDSMNGTKREMYPGFNYSRYKNTDETSWMKDILSSITAPNGYRQTKLEV